MPPTPADAGLVGAMVNIVIGLLVLLLFTRDPDRARRLFLDLREGEDRSGIDIAIFWALTLTIPLVSLGIWVVEWVLHWLSQH